MPPNIPPNAQQDTENEEINYQKLHIVLKGLLEREATTDLRYIVSGTSVTVSVANLSPKELRLLLRSNYHLLFSIINSDHLLVYLDLGAFQSIQLTNKLLKQLSEMSL